MLTGIPRRSTPVLRALVALMLLLVGLAAWTALPATAAATAYEAESAVLTGGAVVASDHTGFTGTGFVGGYTDADKGTAATTFAVSSAAAGSSTVTVRYANGTGSAKSLSLYVNGAKVRQIQLAATADWNTWGADVEAVTLNAGSNSVAVKFDSADSGNVNLDDITVAAVTPPPAGQYEAESAVLSGGAVVASDHTGFTGTGFVGGYTDGDKGTAATAFAVTATQAGAGTVTVRYANGTGSAKSLSLYVNGAKVRQIQLAATADWNTWGADVEAVTLNAGSNSVAVKFDSADSGNVNLDNITVASSTATASPTPTPTATPTPTPTPTPTATGTTPPPTGQTYEAETSFFSGGPTAATATAGYTGSGYLTGFTAQGAQVVVDVDTPTAGAYPVALRYANGTGTAQTISLFLNGIRSGRLSLPAGSGWLTSTQNVTLRSGLNLIGLQTASGDSGAVSVDSVTVTGGLALATTGATVPYTEYTATTVQTNGTVLPAGTAYPSLQSEATARQAVQLTATGQYEQLTLSRPANSVVLRYSIPANSDGSTATAALSLYANGSKVQDLDLTTQYSWLYGPGYYDTRTPGTGVAHHFYDETRALIGNWPAGTVLRFQRDAADTAASYTLDAVDTEQVDPAISMPADYVSITTYGVTPDSGADDTSAVNTAMAALSGTGKGLWFPAGTYLISGRISLNGLSVRGAGQWYTTIRSTAVNGAGGLYATGGTNQIADLSIAGGQTFRNNDSGAAGIEGSFAPGSLVFGVWIEHAKVGVWAVPGNGLYVSGIRVRDVFADGIHLHGGSADSRVDQSVTRNTGDDGVALDTEGGNVTNSVAAYNTVQSPIQGNGIGVYGGANNTVRNNSVSDIVAFGSGITISTAFGGGFNGPTSVLNNTLTRAGSYNSNWGSALGALWIYASNADITQPVNVTGNTILNSTYQGVLLSFGKQISNLTLTNDTVNGAGTYGIDISSVTGSMTATGVTVTGANSGGLNNPGNYTIVRGAGDSGF